MNEQVNSDLSDRELEILQLVATGASNKEIAQKLFISPNTVKVHLRNIFEKIGAVSRTEAALYAIKNNLIVDIGHKDGYGKIYTTQSTPYFENKPIKQGLNKIVLGTSLIIVSALLITILLLLNIPNPLLDNSITNQEQITTSRWKHLIDLPNGISNFATIVLNNKIIIIGGTNEKGVTGNLIIYDPSTNEWIFGKPKPQPVADIQAAILSGKVYVLGGRTPNGEITDKVEVYNPENQQWEGRSPLPFPLSRYALFEYEGNLYVIGGWDGTKSVSNILMYDPSTDKWANKGNLDFPIMDSGTAIVGQSIYLMGGSNGSEASSINGTLTFDLQNKNTHTWQSQTPIPTPCQMDSIAVGAEKIYLLCNLSKGVIYIFYPLTGEWEIIPDKHNEQPFNGAKMIILGNFLYLLGGNDQSRIPIPDIWSYQILYSVSIPMLSK